MKKGPFGNAQDKQAEKISNIIDAFIGQKNRVDSIFLV